jgi:undecaprenyl-diphosphatase
VWTERAVSLVKDDPTFLPDITSFEGVISMQKKLRNGSSPELTWKEISNTVRIFSFEFMALFNLLVFSLLLFYFLVHNVIPEKQNAIDDTAFLILRPYISETHTRIARLVTFLGTGSFLIPSYLVIVLYLLRKKLNNYALLVTAMVMSSLLLGWILKPLFHRIRPGFPLVGGAGGYSFPSGHALGGFIFSGVLLILLWKSRINPYLKWIISFCIFSFGMIIGLSRIYLHVHYATDVMGSLFITLAWFSLSYIFFRLIFKHKLHERQELHDPAPGMIQSYQLDN